MYCCSLLYYNDNDNNDGDEELTLETDWNDLGDLLQASSGHSGLPGP